ncbi:MAG TPA: hypothetical protein VIV60_13160, partial [Polyangiaceae bacterium]
MKTTMISYEYLALATMGIGALGGVSCNYGMGGSSNDEVRESAAPLVANSLAVAVTPAKKPTTMLGSTSHRMAASHPLNGVAAVIETTVSNVHYEYSDALGPRTVVDLSDIVVLAGKQPKETQLSQLGGPLPDGSS